MKFGHWLEYCRAKYYSSLGYQKWIILLGIVKDISALKKIDSYDKFSMSEIRVNTLFVKSLLSVLPY